jgi:homoserine kinase
VSGKSFVVRAPASTANLGPGFDCAAAALDLWNELHVAPAVEGEPLVVIEGEGSDELPQDESHLALRAFALVSSLAGRRFRFVNRIPLERGLGSSAAAVVGGLVAGVTAAGRNLSPERMLELALPLEGHPDNLAAALRGGVCLIWRVGGQLRTERLAADLPLRAIAVVPEARVNTLASRGRLPETLRHDEAATGAAQAALLGAAIAAGDGALLAEAFHDVLHEPFRLPDAPLLDDLRSSLPGLAAGVTLSGSGPTVIVWAEKNRAAAVAAELEARFPDAAVLPLKIAREGARAKTLETVGAKR